MIKKILYEISQMIIFVQCKWAEITLLDKALEIKSKERSFSSFVPVEERNKLATFRIKLAFTYSHPFRTYRLRKMQKRIKILEEKLSFRTNNED